MKPHYRKPFWYALEIFAILLLHFILIRWLADKNIVSAIFAAGEHVPKTTLVLAGFFLLVRITAYLLLPGIVLARLGMIAVDWWK